MKDMVSYCPYDDLPNNVFSIPRADLIKSIQKMDTFVANGGVYDWDDSYKCPGAILTGRNCYDTKRGVAISTFYLVNMNAVDPIHNWYENWEFTRNLLIERYNLEV